VRNTPARFNKPTRLLRSFATLFLILVLGALACDSTDFFGGKPNAIITSPPSGSTFHDGEDIAVQSVSTDSQGVVRVELLVDGQIVRTDAPPSPQQQFTLVQTWKATPGTHTLIVKSYNAANNVSDPAAISIDVMGGSAPAPAATAAPTSTTAPSGPTPTTAPAACTNNSAFIADVTVPDGSQFSAGQTFNKIWRLSNNGTCTWSAGYQFVFVSGEAMTSNTVIAVPSTAPGATADFLVPMTAPTAPGSHAGSWRIRSSTGALFGQVVSVRITIPGAPVLTATPTVTPIVGCSGTPTIAFFNADSTTISVGGSTTLRWGAVTNAETVDLDQGIGGVAAGPSGGSQTVSPASTTTYTMTAHCGSNTATRQVTITVSFGVTSVSANSDSVSYSGSCSPKKTVNFSGSITVNAAGTVTYRWEKSDGSSTASQNLNFSGAGSQTVTDTWDLTAKNSGWEKLHVLTPNDVTSNQANYSVTCTP
jgi:hypothetical protein